MGIPTEMEYLEMYEEKTGYQIKPEWNLYMGFNLFKLAAISQGIMGRVRDGTAAGKNADSFGENAVMMADAAWKLINEWGKNVKNKNASRKKSHHDVCEINWRCKS